MAASDRKAGSPQQYMSFLHSHPDFSMQRVKGHSTGAESVTW